MVVQTIESILNLKSKIFAMPKIIGPPSYFLADLPIYIRFDQFQKCAKKMIVYSVVEKLEIPEKDMEKKVRVVHFPGNFF